MKIKMNAQDELIEALTTKQTDAKVLKKEIKLLKDNLVNQCELIEEIKMMKVHVQKENRIKIARETAYNGLTDIADEIISNQPPHQAYEIKFKAIEKINVLIVQTINTIMDFNNPKRMFIFNDILSSIKNHFTIPPLNTHVIFVPYELRRHTFLQNFINQLFNSGVADGHRITPHHLPNHKEEVNGNGVENLTVKYIGKTLKIIETFVGELLEIGEYKA